MARVNITIPDDLLERARAEGLNISEVARTGLAVEFERLDKIAAVDAYLAGYEAREGPATAVDDEEAEAWARRVLDQPSTSRRSA